MSVFEGVIATLQALSKRGHLPLLPLCQKTSENYIPLIGLPSNESSFLRPQYLQMYL